MTDLTEQEIDGVYFRGGWITINRKALPDVYDGGKETSMGSTADDEFSACVVDMGHTPDYHMRSALCHLAMREYKLDAKQREDANHNNPRRKPMTMPARTRTTIWINYDNGSPASYSIPAQDIPPAEVYTTPGGKDRIKILDTGKVYAIEGTPEDDIRQAAELIAVAIAHMRYDDSERAKTANLTKRRNEVIAQFFPNTKTPPVWDGVLPVVRRMIDHIIELEDKTDD